MPASLPTFSRGLKLVRLAVFVMLIQIVMGIVTSLKGMAANTPDDARDVMKWFEYVMIANLAATGAMFVGVARAIPELRRVRMSLQGLVIAALGFAIATASLAWTYRVLSHFVDVALDPKSDLGDVLTAARSLESLPTIAIVKDLAYGIGLYALIRTVKSSAAINDQLALRDEAASMSRALLVMIIADLFWQLTYGLGESSIGLTGFLGSLFVGIYWIYCHVRLQRFLFNAAWFVNEPHDLPIAILVGDDRPEPRPAAKPAAAKPAVAAKPAPPKPAHDLPERPSQPPLAVVQPPPRVEPPRATSSSDGGGDGPRFLR